MHLVPAMERLAIETRKENEKRRSRTLAVIGKQRARIKDANVVTELPRDPISYLPEEVNDRI